MSSLFRRRSGSGSAARPDAAEPATGPAAEDETSAGTGSAEPDAAEPGAAGSGANGGSGPRAGVKPKAYTPGKGRATPKRRDAQKRTAEPPPKDRKEAARRLRDRQREERAEARAAMMRGDDKYLSERDRGPERRLVRNIVDARRNVGSWFFLVALMILVLGALPVPPQVRFGVDLIWVVMLVAILIDSVLLSRLVKRLVWQRYPDTTQRPAGLYFYAVMRALTLRRMRIPAPQVSVGDAI